MPRTIPVTLQDTDIWSVVTPPEPAPPVGGGLGSFVGQQAAAQPTPPMPAMNDSGGVGSNAYAPAGETPPEQNQYFNAGLLGQVREQRDAEGRTSVPAGEYARLGAATLGIAAGGAALTDVALPAIGSTTLGGMALSGAGGIAKSAALGQSIASIPGYDSLPRPAQTAVQTVPYVLGVNKYRAAAEIAGSVIGSELGIAGAKKLGAPDWVGDVAGQVGFGVGMAKATRLATKGSPWLSKILSQEPGEYGDDVTKVFGKDRHNQDTFNFGNNVDDSSKITGFTTAKGSTYELLDGKTVRNKAERSEHPGDFGVKPQSNKTVYVSARDAQALAIPSNASWRVIDNEDGTISLATRVNNTDRWGIAPSQRNISVSDTPSVGAHPIELWQPEDVYGRVGYKEMHPGSEITSISYVNNKPQTARTVTRYAVYPDAVTPAQSDSLVGSRGAMTVSDPRGVVELYDGQPVPPGMVEMFHGSGSKGVVGELRAGAFLTPNREDAVLFSNVAQKMEGLNWGSNPDAQQGSTQFHAGVAAPNSLYSQVMSNASVPDAGALPKLDQIGQDVVTIQGDSPLNNVARTIVGIPNPSAARETPLGILGTSVQRQRIAAEKLTAERMNWITAAFNSGLGRNIFQWDKDSMASVVEKASGKKVKTHMNNIFEFPERFNLSPEQENAVRVVQEVIQTMEDLRVSEGLAPRQKTINPRGPDDPAYFPRSVTHNKFGTEFTTDTSANLSRNYNKAQDLLDEGYKLADPLSALDNYIADVYDEIARADLETHLKMYGVSPSELVPEPVRIALEKADEALDKQKSLQQREARTIQRESRKAVAKDVKEADRLRRLARANLRSIQSNISGRKAAAPGDYTKTLDSLQRKMEAADATYDEANKRYHELVKDTRPEDRTPAQKREIAKAQRERDKARANSRVYEARKTTLEDSTQPRSIPTSLLRREADAKANLALSEGLYAGMLKKNNAQIKATANKRILGLISPNTLAETARLQKEYDKAKYAYEREMEKVTKAREGGRPINKAYYDAEVVKARGDMNAAKKASEKANDTARINKQSIWQDPDAVQARQDYRDAQKNYNDLLRTKKTEFEGEDVIADDYLGLFHEKRGMEQIQQGLDLAYNAPGPVAGAFQKVANTARQLSTGLDFGVNFVHLLPTLFRNPRAWANGVIHTYGNAVSPRMFQNFMKEHTETFQKMGKYGLGPGQSDLFQASKPGQGLSLGRALDLVPNEKGVGVRRTLQQAGKQTYGRLGYATDSAIAVAQTLLWEGMEGKWTGSEEDLAQHIRNLTGSIDSRALGLGRSARNFEATFLALSPRLLRSTFALVGDLRYLSPNHAPGDRAKGVAALRALTQMTAGAAMLYAGSGYIIGKERGDSDEKIKRDITTGLNPLSGKRFMAHNIGGQWIGFGGTYRAMLQMVAQGASAAAPGGKPIEDLWAVNSLKNPVLGFMISRAAPGLGMAATLGEGLTGANLSSFEQIDSLGDVVNSFGKKLLPYTVAGYIEGDSLIGSGSNTIGLRTIPETPKEKRLDMIEGSIIPQLKGQGIIPEDVQYLDDLSFGEMDYIDRYLKTRYPDMVQAWQDYRRELGSKFQEKADERQRTDQQYNAMFDNILNDLNSGRLDPKQALDHLTNARNQYRGAINKLYDDPEYQRQLNRLDKNDIQTLEEAWFQITNDVAAETGTGTLTSDQWDEVERRQKNFMDNLSARNPALADRLQKSLQMRDSVETAHPLIKAKREVDNASQTYYSLPESDRPAYLKANPALNIQRWYMYGTDLQSATAVDTVLNKQADAGLASQFINAPAFQREVKLAGYDHRIDTDRQTWNNDKSTLVKFLDLTDQQRRIALANIPAMNALAVYWGHGNRLNDTTAVQQFQQKVAQQNWSYWPQAGQVVSLYYALPESDTKNKQDKFHLRAASGKLDAYVALFEEFQYGKQPVFYSQAGASEFFKMTGRDVSKFDIKTIKD